MSNAIHPLPDVDPFAANTDSGAVCKGSYALGSACGKCARCWADPLNPIHLEKLRPPRSEFAIRCNSASSVVNVSILALDLANHTGWAVRRRDGKILHGVEVFTPRASWSPGQRWQRFRSWLSQTIVTHNINAIAYEVIIQGGSLKDGGHKSGAAGDVYGGFKAVMEMVADSHNLVLHPVHVATVKKTWTGNHMAKKPDMVMQARARGFRVEDDNEADALAILHWAIAKETGAWKPTPKRPKPKAKRTAVEKSPKAPAAGQQGALL